MTNPAKSGGRLVRRVRRDVDLAGRTAAEVSLSLVPYVGPRVVAAMHALEIRTISDRIEDFVEEFRELGARLDQTKVNREYLTSAEYVDGAMAALDAARRTSDRNKLRIIAAFLLGAATVDRPADLDVEAVLVSIRDLSPTMLWMAGRIHDLATQAATRVSQGRAIPPAVPDRDMVLSRLVAAGLINAAGTSRFDVFTGEYVPTDTLTRTIRTIRAGGWTPAD
jgi:hypothetical protein